VELRPAARPAGKALVRSDYAPSEASTPGPLYSSSRRDFSTHRPTVRQWHLALGARAVRLCGLAIAASP